MRLLVAELTRPPWPYDTLNHEVAHATVAHFVGLRLKAVRVDRPDDYSGLVTIEVPPDREYEAFLFSIAGPIGEGRPLKWPPRADVPGDEANAARLVRALGFGEQDWNDGRRLVEDILRQPSVRRASRALADRLLEEPRLDGGEAERICKEASENVA
jgi:hypothetical protein